MLELRDYANEGGKLIVDGRNVHQAFTATSAGLSATGPYTWTPDKLFGFFYPANNAGDDDLPGTAFQRSRGSPTTRGRTTSASSAASRRRRRASHGHDSSTIAGARSPRRPAACSPAWRRSRVDATRGQRPEPERRRHAAAAGQVAAAPAQLGRRPTSRCARRRSRPTTPPPGHRHATGGAIISTRDAVTFGFGLEQVDDGDAQRAASSAPELPAADHGRHHAADDRRLQVPGRPLRRRRRRPGRGRADRVRRARRHEVGRPLRRRRARRHRPGLPVPVPLHPAGLGRRQHGQADRRGRRQGGQQSTRDLLRQRRSTPTTAVAVAGAGQPADARRHAGRRLRR